jgi:hypothetical protein
VKVLKLDNWDQYFTLLKGYFKQDFSARREHLFRGQGHDNWKLHPTLDRAKKFNTQQDRDGFRKAILTEFSDECHRMKTMEIPPSYSEEHWEMLARHHGLPTTILDFSRSPFMAAYFAFSECNHNKRVAIWILNRGLFLRTDGDDQYIDLVDPRAWITDRLTAQRGVAIRYKATPASVMKSITKYVAKVTIPASEKKIALRQLDEMGINASSMLPGLDGLAKTVSERLLELE